MKFIELTQGKVTLVDDIDFQYLKQWKWAYTKRGYAVRTTRINENGPSMILMHRAVGKRMRLNLSFGVDHINDDGEIDGLNNQRYNLRSATQSQNNYNQRPRRNCTSKFKGVAWKKGHNKWVVRIQLGEKQRHLGYFDNEIDAAKRYNQFASKHYKEYARLNDI